MRRLTMEDVKKYIQENSECKILSKEYKNAKTKLKFKCICGEIFYISFDGFKNSKHKVCKSCANKVEYTGKKKCVNRESFRKPIADVISLVNSMGCKFIRRYTKEGTRSTVVEFECKEHGLQSVYWTNLVKRKCCPMCNEANKQNSKLTIKVEKFLLDNNLEFIREYKFNGCKNKRKLPFDFYLPTHNICIEVHGRQHYEPAYFGGWSEEVAKQKFKSTIHHDSIKENFCILNNIKLIKIPYHTEKNNEYVEYLNMITLGEVTV